MVGVRQGKSRRRRRTGTSSEEANMLEIFFLIWFARKLASTAKGKGRSGGWAALGVGLWVGGELTGFVIGMVLDLDNGAYLTAILTAVVGAIIAWVVVSNLSDQSLPTQVYESVSPPGTPGLSPYTSPLA